MVEILFDSAWSLAELNSDDQIYVDSILKGLVETTDESVATEHKAPSPASLQRLDNDQHKAFLEMWKQIHPISGLSSSTWTALSGVLGT